MIRAALIVAVALAACGKSKASCKSDVAALMTFLHSFDHEASLFMVADNHKLVQRVAAKPKDQAPVVTITATEMTYRGQLVDASALADGLADTSKRIHDDIETGKIPRGTKIDAALLYFQIDGDATWDRIVAATTTAAAAGFTHASFVFTVPVTETPPPRSWVDAKLDELQAKRDDGGGKATELAKLTGDIVKSCSALTKVYGRVSADENEDKATYIIEGTGPALIECNCDADLPAIRSIMWRLLSNPHPTNVVDVQLAKDGTSIALPATARWRDAQKSLQAGAKVSLATN